MRFYSVGMLFCKYTPARLFGGHGDRDGEAGIGCGRLLLDVTALVL
jgi:hypothetical protein